MNRALVRAEMHISRHPDGLMRALAFISSTMNTTALVALAAGLACIAHPE